MDKKAQLKKAQLKAQLKAEAKTLQKQLTTLKAKYKRADQSYMKAISVFNELVNITPRTRDVKLKLNKAIADKEKKSNKLYYLNNDIYVIATRLNDIKKELRHY